MSFVLAVCHDSRFIFSLTFSYYVNTTFHFILKPFKGEKGHNRTCSVLTEEMSSVMTGSLWPYKDRKNCGVNKYF